MYNIKKIFAHNIKRLRKNRNLTQEQLAEKIGLQWKSVVNFETARNVANSENLQNICNALNISPAELFLVESENSTIEKINMILNKVDKKKLDEIYRVIAVLADKTHFSE